MSLRPQTATSTPGLVPGPVLHSAAEAIKEATAQQKKILIVDDSVIVRKTLGMKLKSSGYDILEAADGGTAVSTARHEKPDLILLDISFPPDVAHGGGVSWDGFLIMAWLKRMDETKNIPVFIITGSTEETHKTRSGAAGAAGFFQKPINNEELLAAIRRTFGQEEPSAGAGS